MRDPGHSPQPDTTQHAVIACELASVEVAAEGLHGLPAGCCGRIVEVGGDCELRRRLLEMGLCRGVNVACVRRALLGGPIEFRVRGYRLALRAEQARCVRVVRTEAEA